MAILDHKSYHHIRPTCCLNTCNSVFRYCKDDVDRFLGVVTRKLCYWSNHLIFDIYFSHTFLHSRIYSDNRRSCSSITGLQKDMVGCTCRNSVDMDWCVDWIKSRDATWQILIQRSNKEDGREICNYRSIRQGNGNRGT